LYSIFISKLNFLSSFLYYFINFGYLNHSGYILDSVMIWYLSNESKVTAFDCIHACVNGNVMLLTKNNSHIQLSIQEFDYLVLKLTSPDKGCYYSYDNCHEIDRQLEATINKNNGINLTQRWWKRYSNVRETSIFLTQEECDTLIYVSDYLHKLMFTSNE
jgi:hypothetical protein